MDQVDFNEAGYGADGEESFSSTRRGETSDGEACDLEKLRRNMVAVAHRVTTLNELLLRKLNKFMENNEADRAESNLHTDLATHERDLVESGSGSDVDGSQDLEEINDSSSEINDAQIDLEEDECEEEEEEEDEREDPEENNGSSSDIDGAQTFDLEEGECEEEDERDVQEEINDSSSKINGAQIDWEEDECEEEEEYYNEPSMNEFQRDGQDERGKKVEESYADRIDIHDYDLEEEEEEDEEEDESSDDSGYSSDLYSEEETEEDEYEEMNNENDVEDGEDQQSYRDSNSINELQHDEVHYEEEHNATLNNEENEVHMDAPGYGIEHNGMANYENHPYNYTYGPTADEKQQYERAMNPGTAAPPVHVPNHMEQYLGMCLNVVTYSDDLVIYYAPHSAVDCRCNEQQPYPISNNNNNTASDASERRHCRRRGKAGFFKAVRRVFRQCFPRRQR